jgi:CHAT domain-containing protein
MAEDPAMRRRNGILMLVLAGQAQAPQSQGQAARRASLSRAITLLARSASVPLTKAVLVLCIAIASVWPGPSLAQPARSFDAAIVCKADTARLIVDQIGRNQLQEADERAAQLLTSAQSEFGAESACSAQAHLLRGTAQQLLGRFEDAGRSFDDAVRLFRLSVPTDHPARTLALNNLGVQRFFMRRYDEALRAHEEALDSRRRATPADELAVAESLHNLADVYRLIGRPPSVAIAMYSEAITLRQRQLTETHRLVADSRQNLASAYELARDAGAATSQLAEALRIQQSLVPRDETAIAILLSRQAAHRVLLGRDDEAEAIYREAVTTLRASNHGQRLALAAVLDDFAVNQLRRKKLADAFTLATEALDVRRRLLPASHPTIARTLSNLAEIEWQRGRYDQALEQSRSASTITLQSASLDAAARLRLQRHVRSLHHRVETVGSTDTALLDEAFRLSQHAIRSGTANTVRALATRLASGDPKLSEMSREVDDLNRSLEGLEMTLALAASSNEARPQLNFTELRATHDDITARRAVALAKVRQAFPRYDQLIRPQPLALSAVQAVLAADESLLVVQVGVGEVYVWAVTRDAAALRRATIHPLDLTDAVNHLRRGLAVEPSDLSRGSEPLFDLGAAHDLYRALFGELEQHFAGKSHIHFVASGPLTSLPLHLLIRTAPAIRQPARTQPAVFKTADWLALHHSISVLPSVESLQFLAAGERGGDRRRPLLAFAHPLAEAGRQVAAAPRAAAPAVLRGIPRRRSAPDLWVADVTTTERLRLYIGREPLPETAAEVRAIAALLGAPESDLHIGAAATETKLKSATLDQYKVLYFATHGFVAGAFASGEPALAMTVPRVPSIVDDGLLTASEAAALKLDADLVVLSACDTAAGDASGADGLSGLTRAFMHAGARALLVSHWSVDSFDTKALMLAVFDARAKSNRTTSGALQVAMLARIAAAPRNDPWSAYPGRWAPFVLVGAR